VDTSTVYLWTCVVEVLRQPLAAIDGTLVLASVTPFSGVTWLRERRITVTASTTSHAK
jgi:hypothetical protein